MTLRHTVPTLRKSLTTFYVVRLICFDNLVAKGEIGRLEQFLLLPQNYQSFQTDTINESQFMEIIHIYSCK